VRRAHNVRNQIEQRQLDPRALLHPIHLRSSGVGGIWMLAGDLWRSLLPISSPLKKGRLSIEKAKISQ
jgi:hypothetical protein